MIFKAHRHTWFQPAIPTPKQREAFTEAPAWCARKEKVQGAIRPGMWADLTVFEKDLFELEPTQWLEVKTEMTIVDGQAVYLR